MVEKGNHPENQYLDLLRDILDNGIKNVDRGTGSVSYGVFGRQTRYDLSKGFPLLTTKKVFWRGIVHELYWFMSGDSNIKYLVDNRVHIWDDYPYKLYQMQMDKGRVRKISKEEFIERIAKDRKFAKKWGELPRIYGEMWRRWPTHKKTKTIDQLKWAINEIKDDPEARNAMVTSWNPEYLYTMADRKNTSYFPVCHNLYQISQKYGKLSLQLYQRSADVFLGVPFNIASYALLTIIIAQVTGYKPGEFIHTFGDVHIYENHLAQVKEQLSRKPKPLPTVTLDRSVKNIDDFRPELVSLENYEPYSSIRAELTVAGGYYEKTDKDEEKAVPTAAVLLIKGSKVLLVKHKKGTGHLPGVYGLPSGLISKGENEKDTALRELQEETGLKTKKANLVEFPNNFYTANIKRSDNTTRKFSMKVFYCRDFEGSLRQADETIPEWLERSELSSLKLLPNVKKTIESGFEVREKQYAKN